MKAPFIEVFNEFLALDFFSSEKITKSYADFLSDIKNIPINTQNSRVVVKNPDPYLFLVEVFALWGSGITPILISPKETKLREVNLVKEINFQKNNDEALILFTSGSTGNPKAIALTFLNIKSHINIFKKLFIPKISDVFLLNLPQNHVGGLMLCLRAFFSGGKISTNALLPYSFISLVPHQLKEKLQDPLLKSARVILIGGAPLPSALKNAALTLNLPLYETYGMTETTSFIAINGKIVSDCEVKINDDGLILIKGPMVATNFDDWLKTSDLGLINSLNLLELKGRKNNLLISGGENINPYEIEKLTLEIPGVENAFLVSVPDEKLGDLLIMLYEGENPKEELKKILHPYHVPKYFYKTDLSFKTTKISRTLLHKNAYSFFLKNIFSHQYIHTSDSLPTVVLFHGFMESKEDWKFLVEELKLTHNLLSLDLPGHGGTQLHHFSSLEEIYKRLRDFISLFHEMPIFIGYSMGGRIALSLAEDYLKPQKLILISSSFGLENKKEQEKRLKTDLELFSKISENYFLKDFFYDWYNTPMFKPFFDSENFNLDIEKKSKNDFSGWAQSLKYFSPGNFPIKKEYQLDIPLSYICGSEDPKYQRENALIIKGAGHNPHKTHPEFLCALIRQILPLKA